MTPLRLLPLFVLSLACTHVSDLGEHLGAAVDPCPAKPPTGDTPCPAGASGCLYRSACGARDVASCVDGAWIYWSGACTTRPPSCPPESPPPLGEPCPSSGPLACSFRNACGAYFTATCDGATPWTGEAPACSEPCPEAPPANGAPCGAADMVCSWKNACATLDHGRCTAGRWIVETGCDPSCGTSLPKGGASCTSLGLTCEYAGACDGGTQKATCLDFVWSVDPTCT